LSRKAQAVYVALRKEMFDGEMVNVHMLAAELLMSRTAFWHALEELQEYGFCAMDEGMD
jgi:biotin operon repressor